MDDLLPVEPVRPPSPARRRLLAIVTLLLIVAFVVVAGLEGSGFILRSNPAPTGLPIQPAAPARLAYIAPDGTLNILDGSSTVRFGAAPGAAQFPTWSPDRTRLAVIRSGPDATNLDVVAPPAPAAADQADDTPPTVVYTSSQEPPFYLYWAPDGKALAFLTSEPDGSIALRRVVANAGQPDTMIRRGAPMYWQWVDPSRLLVHSGGEAPDAFAGEVGLDGAPLDSVAVQAGAFRAPAMSADRTHVAYTTLAADGARSMVVASSDGTVRHDVAVYTLAAFEFDPAGDSLAFVAGTTAGGATDFPVGPLRIVDPLTGNVRTLIEGDVVTFFWSPDGRTIAALEIPGLSGTNAASIKGTAAVLAKAEPGGIQAAAGLTLPLFFVDAATGAVRSQQAVRPSDLFVGQVLPYFDQYALSHRFWSPDSRSLALPTVDDQGASRITTFFADGSNPVDLVAGLFASWSP